MVLWGVGPPRISRFQVLMWAALVALLIGR